MKDCNINNNNNINNERGRERERDDIKHDIANKCLDDRNNNEINK